MKKHFVSLMMVVLVAMLSGCATIVEGRVYSPQPRPQSQQWEVVSATSRGLTGHLDSYRRPQELVGQQELRVENARSGNYLQSARIDQQTRRNDQRYELELQRQAQRRNESLSRIVSDQLNGMSRRQAEKERTELNRRRQTQHEVRELNRSIERAGNNIARQLQSRH